MEGLRQEREAIQRLGTRELGYPKRTFGFARIFGIEVQSTGSELNNLALPLGGCSSIQDAIGRNYFVIGLSTPGGGDIVPGSAEDDHPW